jgi:hypothetical protein
MNLKENTERVLEDLKNLKWSRRKIEAELGYSPKYIDQQLSKGGNDKLLAALKRLHKQILDKAIKGDAQLIKDRAMLRVLVREIAELKVKLYGGNSDDYARELGDRATALADALKDL